jgi:hypothetical protein
VARRCCPFTSEASTLASCPGAAVPSPPQAARVRTRRKTLRYASQRSQILKWTKYATIYGTFYIVRALVAPYDLRLGIPPLRHGLEFCSVPPSRSIRAEETPSVHHSTFTHRCPLAAMPTGFSPHITCYQVHCLRRSTLPNPNDRTRLDDSRRLLRPLTSSPRRAAIYEFAHCARLATTSHSFTYTKITVAGRYYTKYHEKRACQVRSVLASFSAFDIVKRKMSILLPALRQRTCEV